MDMDRKTVTKKLTDLVSDHLFKDSIMFAKEVCVESLAPSPRRVDIMSFEPFHRKSVAGIEAGIFTCYEIKSCIEDVYSGNGLNFYGDKNYIVLPMHVWAELGEDHRFGKLSTHIEEMQTTVYKRRSYGIIAACAGDPFEAYKTRDDGPIENWVLNKVIASSRDAREKSALELLFAITAALYHGR